MIKVFRRNIYLTVTIIGIGLGIVLLYRVWAGSPGQIAQRVANAIERGDYETLYRAGLQSCLTEPSYDSKQLRELLSTLNVVGKAYEVKPVGKQSQLNTNFVASNKATGDEFYINLEHTPDGWKLNDVAFMIVRLRRGLKQGSKEGAAQFADAMDKAGIAVLYQPYNSLSLTSSDIRSDISWQAAPRRTFTWER